MRASTLLRVQSGILPPLWVPFSPGASVHGEPHGYFGAGHGERVEFKCSSVFGNNVGSYGKSKSCSAGIAAGGKERIYDATADILRYATPFVARLISFTIFLAMNRSSFRLPTATIPNPNTLRQPADL